MNTSLGRFHRVGVMLFLPLMLAFLPRAAADAIGDALNQPQLTWQATPSIAYWRPQADTTHDGVSALQYTGVDKVTLSTTVNGPLQVTFWWKFNSRFSGFFDFVAGGQSTFRELAGTTNIDWQQVSVGIDPGPQLLKWTLNKADGWLDEVSFSERLPEAPQVTSQPFPVTGLPGSKVNLTTTATGSPLFLQWLRDGQPVPGATNQNFNVTNAQPDLTGTYQLVASNQLGVATSKPVFVNVAQPVVLTRLASYTVTNGPIRGIGFVKFPGSAATASARGRARPAGDGPPLDSPYDAQQRLFVFTDGATAVSKEDILDDLKLEAPIATAGKPVFLENFEYSAAGDQGVAFAGRIDGAWSPNDRGYLKLPPGSGSAVAVELLYGAGGIFMVVQTTNPSGFVTLGPLPLGANPRFSGYSSIGGGDIKDTYTGPPFPKPVTALDAAGNSFAVGTAAGISLFTGDADGKLSLKARPTNGPTSSVSADRLAIGNANAAGNALMFGGSGQSGDFYRVPAAGAIPVTNSKDIASARITDVVLTGAKAIYGEKDGKLEIRDAAAVVTPDGFPIPLAVGGTTMNPPVQGDTYVAASGLLIAAACGDLIQVFGVAQAHRPPKIIQQTASATVSSARPATLKVVAVGDGPLTYQWYETDVYPGNSPTTKAVSGPGATSDTLVVESVALQFNPPSRREFYVEVSANGESVRSLPIPVSESFYGPQLETVAVFPHEKGIEVVLTGPDVGSIRFEESSDLSDPAGWGPATYTARTEGDKVIATITAPADAKVRFFRAVTGKPAP